MRIPAPQAGVYGRRFIDLSQEVAEAILATVEAGWVIARVREEVTADVGEVTLSECLRDGMRDVLNRGVLPWGKMMAVLPGTESRSLPELTTPDGRTDIPLFLVPAFYEHGEHDPHAIIECKRVAEGNTSLSRQYVIDGVDRFKSGKYAENHARGFMIGYVISGSEGGVVGDVNAYLSRCGRVNEQLAPAGSARWTSSHSRSGTRGGIALYHSMLKLN